MRKVILACLVLMFAGCASRKKEVLQHKSKYEFTSAIDTSFHFTGSFRQHLESKEQEQNSSAITRVNYDGKKGDSLSIKKFGPDGKLQSETLITGAGKADITEAKSSGTRELEFNSNAEAQADHLASGHRNTDVEEVKRDTSKTLTSKGIAWTWSFWLIIFVMLYFIVRWYISKYSKNGV